MRVSWRGVRFFCSIACKVPFFYFSFPFFPRLFPSAVTWLQSGKLCAAVPSLLGIATRNCHERKFWPSARDSSYCEPPGHTSLKSGVANRDESTDNRRIPDNAAGLKASVLPRVPTPEDEAHCRFANPEMLILIRLACSSSDTEGKRAYEAKAASYLYH